MLRRICLFLLFVVFSAHSEDESLTQTSLQFTQSLSGSQQQKVFFNFDDQERVTWHFVPMDRQGLPLKEMDETQQALAMTLLTKSLSPQGLMKAQQVIELEQVLFELSGESHRDKTLYYVSIFGDPKQDKIWAWRFEGHHLSLNFTVKDGELASVTPNFWGANPAHVPSGSKKGLRVLGDEEDLARELINSFTAQQRQSAIIAKRAYSDILTGTAEKVLPLKDKGIAYAMLSNTQQQKLLALIGLYLNKMPKSVALERFAQIQQSDLVDIKFAWAGSTTKGKKHYYRIQGQSFLIEYDNAQNNGNHVHTVWRDFNGDFGRDILLEHHQTHQH